MIKIESMPSLPLMIGLFISAIIIIVMNATEVFEKVLVINTFDYTSVMSHLRVISLYF